MKYSTAFAAALLGSTVAAQDYRLNDSPETGTRVRDFRVTADGKRVVYLARPRADEWLHIYLVNALNPRERQLLDGRDCTELELAGKRIVYSWYDGTFHISSLLIDGLSGPVDLALGLGARPTPDGETVVFRMTDGLYSVPADGSAPPRRLQTSTPAPVHHQWVLTPDSRRVVYVTEGSIHFQAGLGHLYSALLDGSAPPVVLNSDAAPCGVGNHVVSPDSRWIVYRRVDIARGVGLYRVPIDGSAPPVRLHDPLPAGAEVVIYHAYTTPLFTPDSSRVVYRLEQEAPDLTELYSAPLDGSAPPVKLNDGVNRFAWMFRLTPDGARVVYLASARSFDDPTGLFGVPVAGGAPPQPLNAPLAPGGSVLTFSIGPDSARVVYLAEQESLGQRQLFSTSTSGGPFHMLSPPDQACYWSHPDVLVLARGGDSVVYPTVGFVGGEYQVELFAARVDGLGRPYRLNGPIVAGGTVIGLDPFYLSPAGFPLVRLAVNGTLALFRADQEKDEVFELWAAPIPAEPFRRKQ